MLETWQPEPLVPELNKKERIILENCPVIEGYTPNGDAVLVRGIAEPVIDCCTFDFLGMSQDDSVKKATREALDYYGCGSCGPRGFYGTIDQHLNFELAIANVRISFASLITFISSYKVQLLFYILKSLWERKKPSAIPTARLQSLLQFRHSQRKVTCCWSTRQ